MPGLPELPVNVPATQRQKDGKRDEEPVYQTHRGPKHDNPDRPRPNVQTPDVALRYEDQP